MTQPHIVEGKSHFSLHLVELHTQLRISAIALGLLCEFWSYFVDNIMTAWIELLPLQTGPGNENMSIYGPFDWVEVRWSMILVLAFTTLLPLSSVQIYWFSRKGLYPRERTWLSAVLLLSTTVVPLLIVAIWAFATPQLFNFAATTSTIDGIGVSYDASSIFSLALGASWILIIWALTIISIGMARLYGLVAITETRFRYRLLAISAGTLLLTLPVEFDGLRILISLTTVFTADVVSKAIPIIYPLWGDESPNDSLA